MEPKLDLVQATCKSEKRHVSALNNTDKFFTCALSAFGLVGCHWYEWLQPLLGIEALQTHTHIEVVVE